MPLPADSPRLRRRHPELPDHLTWEPSSRWVRAVAGGVTVVDTRAPILVWEARQKVPESRDPHHRVDAVPSSRHVVVRDGDRVLADSTATVAVYETGLPTRWYLPRADVRTDALERSDTVSECPDKGHATEYWALRRPDGVVDVAWSYPDPFPAVGAVRGLVAFWGERVTVEVDGVIAVTATDVRV